MAVKKTLILFAIASLTAYSCVDRLTFYHHNYKPTLNSDLRFDGYYENKERPWKKIAANPYTPKHFYCDGLVAYHVNYKNGKPVKEICTKENSVKVAKGRVSWGAYNISGDTLTVEVLKVNFDHLPSIDRTTNKFIIKKDTLFLFMWATKGSKATYLSDTLYFHPFPFKPDSSKSWIRKVKKYNR